MSTRRVRSALLALILTTTASMSLVAPAVAAEEAGPPQPDAIVMTRTCEQNGAIVVMNNLGGGSVTFSVLVDNEPSGTYTVLAGSAASHLVAIMEGQTVNILVTADGMSPVSATRTRDCGAPEPAPADAPPAGATDPVDAVPAGTPAPAPAPGPAPAPTAVAGAAEGPSDTQTTDAAPTDSGAATAPAGDPAAPSGSLPFTGAVSLGWLALAGSVLVGAGAALRRVGRADDATPGTAPQRRPNPRQRLHADHDRAQFGATSWTVCPRTPHAAARLLDHAAPGSRRVSALTLPGLRSRP